MNPPMNLPKVHSWNKSLETLTIPEGSYNKEWLSSLNKCRVIRRKL